MRFSTVTGGCKLINDSVSIDSLPQVQKKRIRLLKSCERAISVHSK